MFSQRRNHIPYLQIIIIPLCRVTKKATDFQWEQEKRQALETTCKFLYVHVSMTNAEITDILFMDIVYWIYKLYYMNIVYEYTFIGEYGNWELVIK